MGARHETTYSKLNGKMKRAHLFSPTLVGMLNCSFVIFMNYYPTETANQHIVQHNTVPGNIDIVY